MTETLKNNRLLSALRLAFYPAFEPAAEKRFQALTREISNARNAGEFARAEQLCLRAMADREALSDPSHLHILRYDLAQVYQEQKRYREAERIFRDQLAEAVKSPEPNMQVHAAHMSLARLYNDEGDRVQAEEHYRAALAETEKAGGWPTGELYCSTASWLAKFYVEQHRYRDAEPLFQRIVEIREVDSGGDSSLPHYLQELAKVYEAQERYEAAEESYRRALRICEELELPTDFLVVNALKELARFCKERRRYAEAEELSRRSLALIEEKIKTYTVAETKRSLRSSTRETREAAIRRVQVPIGEALDRVAEICECQEKYAEAEPLRKRSFEIKHDAWGENYSWIWVDSLAAYANVLHKLGREEEASEFDRRVEAIRVKHPPGSVRSYVRLTSTPLKRTLRGRFTTFMNALLHPSPR